MSTQASGVYRSRSSARSARSGATLFGGRVLHVLGRVLALLLAVVLAIPVLLLPLSTAVPAWIAIVCLLTDAALIVLQFRLGSAWRGITVGIAGAVLVSMITIVASQVFAATPAINGADGKPIPGSVASLEMVSLNGSDQWITIRGHDATKPVLLHLGMGGPGAGGFASRSLFEPLEKDFVIVSWDEPGTGKSIHSVPFSELTPERFIEDAYALTLYLRERFHQEKIYVYGVSWTSILGVWLVQRYPELYWAYIGNGQMVNTTGNDVMGYQFAIQYLTERGDSKSAEQLRRNGPPPYTGKDMVGKYVSYLDVLNQYMGSLPFTVAVPIVPFMAPEYGYIDKINHTRGLVKSFQVVYPQLKDLDFMTQAPKLEVPIYIFAGRDDVNAMSSLVEKYFEKVQAPHKRLIWLEGGHGLDDRSLPQFVDIMVNTVLPDTQPPE